MSTTTFSGPVASQNGFIENSFTTAERDAIPSPSIGLLIYNTETNVYEVYNGTAWQSAFGPGPTPPISFPVTLAYLQRNSFYDTALTFNADGTRLYRAGGNNVYVIPVSTPWDISTADYISQVSYTIGASLPPYLPGGFQSGVAWNATGTQLSLIASGGGYNYTQVTATVTTPYDLTTFTGLTVAGSAMSLMSASSIVFGDSGNKAYVMGGGAVNVFNLPSPYNWVGSSATPDIVYNLAAVLGLYNYPQQIAFSPDGSVGIVIQSGATYEGVITQFQLGTPWDITTVNTGTATSLTVSPSMGYVGFGGCTVKPDFSQLYVTGGMMSQYIYQYTIS